MTSLENDQHYILLKKMINEHITVCDKASQSIQNFRQLLIDHLAPEHTIVELENTPIYLEDLDDELKPQVQEHLTNYYAYKQEASLIFKEISQVFYKLHTLHPEISLADFKNMFETQNIPLYFTPVKPNTQHNYHFEWNNNPKTYQLYLTVTSNKEFLLDKIKQYGYKSIDESYTYLDQCGFATLINDHTEQHLHNKIENDS
jgi:hypothetical protein